MNHPSHEPKRSQGTRFMEDRYIQIQKILVHYFRHPRPDGRLITADEIAERLGVKVSMIRRDIHELVTARGLPIESVRGEGGGYRLTEDITSFPDLHLSATELYILTMAMRALAGHRGLAEEKDFRRVVGKLFATLDEGMTIDVKRLEELVTFRPGRYEAPVDLAVFEKVMRALLDQEELTFTHTKPHPDAKPQRRHVQPRHLATIINNWYLFTDDLGNNGARRHFALTRVANVEGTGKHFVPAEPFDLDQDLNGSIGVHTGGVKQTIRLRFSRTVRTFILERQWHSKQRFEHLEDGRVDLIFEAPVNEELMRLVLHWGADVQVIEPADLRDSVIAEAQRVLANYAAQSV